MGKKKVSGQPKKRKKGKQVKRGWFHKLVRILNSRWFAAAVALVWSAAARGKERK